MGIAETLQESLVNANNERHNWHNIVQGFDGRILDVKISVQRAQSHKDSLSMVHEDCKTKYVELLNYTNGLTDADAKSALAPDLEERAQEVTRMVRRVHEAEESLRHWQRKLTDTGTERANASARLAGATQRWEQIQTQIGNPSQSF